MNKYKEYPFNLLSELGIERVELQTGGKPSFDVQAGIAYALSTLKIKERMVIRLWFEEDLKTKDICEIMSLSREGVHFLKEEALKKMRNPIISGIAQYGVVGYAQKRYKDGFTDAYRDPETTMPIKKASIEILGLSVRAYNSLKRFFGALTIEDICDLDETEIGGIRCFGAKSADEVARALRGYGITGTAWDNFLID